MFRERPASIFVRLAGLGALLLVCDQTACGAGVTVIVHGYHDESETWIKSMAFAMEDRVAGPASVAMYTLVIKSRWDWLGRQIIGVDSFTRDVGSPSIRDNGEVIVKVNWADVDGGVCGLNVVPTTIIGEIVAEALTLPNVATDGTLFHRLCELPIHLIGHSRGGSAVAETARILGASGIWVDHLTTLDPHPLFCGDASLNVYDNVSFADNYYEDFLLTVPDGEPVIGAYNTHLTSLQGGYGDGLGNGNHNDVHLWYHGTIGPPFQDSDGHSSIGTDWYSYPQPSRDESGFHVSRLAGGFRDRPLTWVSSQHGGTNSRLISQRHGAQWANVGDITIPEASGLVVIGDRITVEYRYQDFDSGATIEWYLDNDTNPYNSGAILLHSDHVNSTGVNVQPASFSLGTEGFSAGRFYIYAKIQSDNGDFVRYDYAELTLNFWSSPLVPVPAITSVDPNALPGLPLAQTQLLKIHGNNFLTDSRLEFFDGTTTYPGRVPIYVSPTELRYNIKVGNVTANWTVKVRNGSNVSAAAAFTVVATADASAPPAPIGLIATFVSGLSNDFYYVDWTNPNDSSGIAKVWFKLGSAPTSPTDGLGLDIPLFQPLPVATLTANPQTIYVWLEDGQGNKDQNNRSNLLLYRTTGPIIILTPPQNRTVVEGASALFCVVASGSQPLSYQWQRSDDGGSSVTNVPGATDSTYVTPAATLADNEAQFTVQITNLFGVITSAPTTLEVTTAVTNRWLGTASGGWTNAANWSLSRVPIATDSVLITNSGTIAVPPNSTFAVMSVTNAGLTGGLIAAGTVNWSGGALVGDVTIGTGTVVNIMGSQNKNLGGGCVVSNLGFVVWTGGGDLEFGDSVWHNLPGSVFELQNDTSFVWVCTDPLCLLTAPPLLQLQNAGIFRKIRGNGTSKIGYTQFTNSGRVELESGILQFEGGGRAFRPTLTSAGPMHVAAGTSVVLAGGKYQFNPGHSFIGGGSVQAVGGILTGTIDSGDFKVSPGGGISGTFTNVGRINWTGGSLYGVTIKNKGVLDISGDSSKSLVGTLVNSGRITWSGTSDISGDHLLFQNLERALFEIKNNQTFFDLSGSGYLDNAGLLLKSDSAGVTTFDGFDVSNRGTILVQSGRLNFNNGFTQTAGDTRLSGGSLSGGTLNFNGGTLTGNGTINASVVNKAVVSPGSSAGTLTVNGSYTQGAAGVLQMELGGLAPGSEFDRLVVNGQATLAGALNVTLLNSFTPAFADFFPLLSYVSPSGSFGSLNLPSLPNALAMTAQYGPSTLTLMTASAGGNNQTNSLAALLPAQGPLEIRFTGKINLTYRLQASTNLLDWLDLSTNTPPFGLFRFLDPDAAHMDRRFYRAVSP